MKILYIEENKSFSETFISSEKEILRKHGCSIEEILISDLKINVKELLVNFLFKNTFSLFTVSLLILFKSAHNFTRFSSNLSAILIFYSNIKYFLPICDNVDHIRAHFLAKRSTFALLLYLKKRIPFSCVAHAADIFEWDNSIILKIKFAKKIYSISNYNCGYLDAKTKFKYSSKIKLIRNSFKISEDPIRELSSDYPQKRIELLFVGRLVQKKNLDRLIKILSHFPNSSYRLTIIGDGPLYFELKDLAYNLLNHSDFVFLGKQPSEIVQLEIEKTDYVVLLSSKANNKKSDMDGIPTVFFEALSRGVPIISTEVSGIPEFLHCGVNGHIVDLNLNNDEIAHDLISKINNNKFSSNSIRHSFDADYSNLNGAEVLIKDI